MTHPLIRGSSHAFLGLFLLRHLFLILQVILSQRMLASKLNQLPSLPRPKIQKPFPTFPTLKRFLPTNHINLPLAMFPTRTCHHKPVLSPLKHMLHTSTPSNLRSNIPPFWSVSRGLSRQHMGYFVQNGIDESPLWSVNREIFIDT